jgi:hypothetical protein
MLLVLYILLFTYLHNTPICKWFKITSYSNYTISLLISIFLTEISSLTNTPHLNDAIIPIPGKMN